MSSTGYITSNCIVSNGAVFSSGESLFESAETDLSAFLLSAYQRFQPNYPKFYKMDNLSKLGWLASEVLLKNFDKDRYKPEEVGLVLANKNSSLDDDLKYWESANEVIASPSLFVYTLPNIVIGEICIRNQFKGEHTFYIQDKFDADFITKQVNFLLDNNILQTCICGWVDVLGEEYKAALYLVEKEAGGSAIEFSAGNMNKVFEL
ncbi:MAG TPA: hypothetical protein VJ844_05895 [Mucilaginibacter sp.]|nr:hypothetical protein [Mucilaginibacter sp.]